MRHLIVSSAGGTMTAVRPRMNVSCLQRPRRLAGGPEDEGKAGGGAGGEGVTHA